MHLKWPLPYHPTRYIIQHPSLTHTNRHPKRYRKRRGDGSSFEVLRFPRSVFGEGGYGDVKAGEAGEATEDEEGEDEGIKRSAEAERESQGGGGDAEGDLGKFVRTDLLGLRFKGNRRREPREKDMYKGSFADVGLPR